MSIEWTPDGRPQGLYLSPRQDSHHILSPLAPTIRRIGPSSPCMVGAGEDVDVGMGPLWLPVRAHRRILLALGLSVFLLCSWLTPVSQQPAALAHAFVIGSDPVDGSTVSSPPRAVRIFFDAPISPASNVYVYTPDERIVNAARSSISTTNPRELDTPLMPPDQLPQGSYTVRWTALASVDGHTTHGVIGFNIGQSSAGLPGETILGPSTSNILPDVDLLGILAVAWEWLVLMALTFWV